MSAPVFKMQSQNGVGYGGPITGTVSGNIYVPTSAGIIQNVALSDVVQLVNQGYAIVPSDGAGSATGNASNGNSNTIVAGNGGSSTGGGGNGGNGGDIILAPGAKGTHNGGGSDGRDGLIIPHTGAGAVGLPTADPHVVGALWANMAVVTVSAG